MQHRARTVAHLVKLVDAADAVVAQHQSSCLQDQLPGLRVLHHVGGETHSTGALPRRVLSAGHQVVDVLQQLGLAGSGISAQQDVHLCAEVAAAGLTEVLTGATKQLQQNALETPHREIKVAVKLIILYCVYYLEAIFNLGIHHYNNTAITIHHHYHNIMY